MWGSYRHRQILLDCGIGTPDAESTVGTVAQHRVLIFCQLKQMLDLVEKDLLQALMPTVTYMRMDGATDVSKRHAVVQTFNADPSIDCLLLTTHVGGLGLNLTGADTVIFVEHDWNPMKDLQAMDRAHRLGQKKVVNVYRLIMRGTLEEKIMGCVFLSCRAGACACAAIHLREEQADMTDTLDFNASSSISPRLSSHSKIQIWPVWARIKFSISLVSRRGLLARRRRLRPPRRGQLDSRPSSQDWETCRQRENTRIWTCRRFWPPEKSGTLYMCAL